MGRRKDTDKSPRKSKVRQVCLTPAHDQMLAEVALKRYQGKVSHALLGLWSQPLKKAYLELALTADQRVEDLAS